MPLLLLLHVINAVKLPDLVNTVARSGFGAKERPNFALSTVCDRTYSSETLVVQSCNVYFLQWHCWKTCFNGAIVDTGPFPQTFGI